MAELITKSQLADIAGVSRDAVTRALKGGLQAALTRDGRRVNSEHPAALKFLADARRSRQERGEPPDPGPPVTPSETPGPDGLRRENTARVLYDVEQQIAGVFPDDLTDLGSMPLREVVDRFGSLAGLREVVRALKDFADMRNKEGLAAQRRGTLIARDLIGQSFVPLVDMAFLRLVGEVPTLLTEQIVARVNSGGDELRGDVETILIEQLSKVLTECRDAMAKLVRELPCDD